MTFCPYEEEHVHDEIIDFIMDATGYYAVSTCHGLITIVRSKPIQPPIGDERNYTTYLWVEGSLGFYLLAQQIVKGKPQEWFLLRCITPEAKYGFFDAFEEHLLRTLDAASAAGEMRESP